MTAAFELTVFAAGVGVAAFVSPCAYALLPGYLGYYIGMTEGNRPSLVAALVRGGAAAVGAVTTFVILAATTAMVGDTLASMLPALEIGVSLVLIALGLVIVAGRDLSVHVSLPKRRSSVTGFGLFGALYAVAAAGCVAPLFLAVVVQALPLAPVETAGVFAALTAPFATLLVGATVGIAFGVDVYSRRVSRISSTLVRAAGVILVLAGGAQLWFVVG